MEEYYFLFGLALAYVIFATIEDIRKREVANWLNFSFLTFALTYRALYAVIESNADFFILGIIGFGVFYLVGNMFYYSKIFGGGDVKLLMGIGVILPYSGYTDIIFKSGLFLITLFLAGAVYSLLYSCVLTFRNYNGFKKEFGKQLKQGEKILTICFVLALIILVAGEILGSGGKIWLYEAIFVVAIGFLYIYLKSIERSSMIKLVEPAKLTEGDWLEKDVKVGNKLIRRSVHGLSYAEINQLKRHKVKVWVRYGVPFVPAFLIALAIMVYAWAVLNFDFEGLLSSLF